MEEQLFPSVSQLIFGGIVAAAVAFGIFQWFGKQWIESSFVARINILRREHNALVARLKLEIESMLEARKLTEMDFNTLPGTWERLEKAYNMVNSFVALTEHQVDVRHLDLAELEEMLGTMEWFQSEINRVKAASGFTRQKEFYDIRFSYQLRRVKDACREFDEYIAVNAIFYPASMLAELRSISETLHLAIGDKERAFGSRDVDTFMDLPARMDLQFRMRVDEMAASIRKKLENHEATPPV